ncbi:hypothetical protein QDG88_13980 [Pseudoalteromonas piscicida]|uniref:DUF6933 domain-containing protein n=1 Tax=Pseudoalteromonas piscicida TaxID=43662 RepID=UPI002738AF4A|nr:hypothetical protein [Pseudoalteromonas piscicida]MDP4489028.1 hypothetical protein [Pseudoalteromonas piscicida]
MEYINLHSFAKLQLSLEQKDNRMINLFCTQKLIVKLPVNDGVIPACSNAKLTDLSTPDTHPLSDWHANLLTIQRRNCVLLIHNQTRFPVFMIGLTKPDFAKLDFLFADSFMNTLLNVDANNQQLQKAASLLGPLTITKANNRSVQGTMNQMKGDIEHQLWFDQINIMDCSPYRTAAWLAERPCMVKGQKDCIWPIKEMLALLS